MKQFLISNVFTFFCVIGFSLRHPVVYACVEQAELEANAAIAAMERAAEHLQGHRFHRDFMENLRSENCLGCVLGGLRIWHENAQGRLELVRGEAANANQHAKNSFRHYHYLVRPMVLRGCAKAHTEYLRAREAAAKVEEVLGTLQAELAWVERKYRQVHHIISSKRAELATAEGGVEELAQKAIFTEIEAILISDHTTSESVSSRLDS